ncbi:MAG: hypothetical protein V4686_02900 [Patescibacteria group bacterium]
MKNNTFLTLILTIIIAIGVYVYMENRVPPIIVEEPTATTTVQTPTPGGKISLQLESDGLGGLKFGATEEDVLSTFNRALGSSTKDTGWTNSFSMYGTCPGTQIRVVEWNRLRVFFGDTKFGMKKFFQYEYTDRDAAKAIPLITTAKGVTLNTTKAELQRLYPAIKITPWTENYAQYERFSIDDSLQGTLKGGKVFWINAGVQCGE